MTIKEAHHYLFYKLYKFWEKVSVPEFLTDVKTVISIIVLEEFLATSLMIYYKTFINKKSHLGEQKLEYIIASGVIAVINYFCFFHNDEWKSIIKEYDKRQKKTSNSGSIVIGLLILAVFINFIVAYYFYFNR